MRLLNRNDRASVSAERRFVSVDIVYLTAKVKVGFCNRCEDLWFHPNIPPTAELLPPRRPETIVQCSRKVTERVMEAQDGGQRGVHV